MFGRPMFRRPHRIKNVKIEHKNRSENLLKIFHKKKFLRSKNFFSAKNFF